MTTLVAMLSFGPRPHLSDVAFPRASGWAARHGYSSVLIKTPLHRSGELPHFGKLRIPERFPGYERYCIIDDDLLISRRAPELPDITCTSIGLAPDAEQRHTKNPTVKWTGNTGFIIAPHNSLDLLQAACERGPDDSVWGIADQGALNSVAWAHERVQQIDRRWNTQCVLDYFLRGKGWDKWRCSRSYRIGYYARLVSPLPNRARAAVRDAWGLHLIRAPYPRFYDRFLP